MIQNFKCRETEKIWNNRFSQKFPDSIQQKAKRKLIAISISESIEDLRTPPSNHLEKLKHDRKGQCSIRINEQWRVCFKWEKGNAINVEIVDYH